jgi:quercetin 2,3-dioxygenase
MANYILHTAQSRGHAQHGWLDSYHTFSFAQYYNPERIHFGALRVLNDDTVDAAMGFGMHPHDNMEIITIPLEGALKHQDSMGNTAIIQQGEIQVMSAGTGIYHSEYNAHVDRAVKLLQIWVFPNQKSVVPRYDQIVIQNHFQMNAFQQIVSPSPDDAGVWIHQDTWFHLGTFETGKTVAYALKKEGNGVYAFIIKGKAKIDEQVLEERDGLGIWETTQLQLQSLENDTQILLMEVPMVF